jgi:hypothetical protein
MPSGLKQLIINSRERALSTDINRLQSFAAAGWAEVFRYLLNVGGNDDLDSGGVLVENVGLGSPLSAEIIGGLLVRPVNGTLNLKVDPGVLMAVAPDNDGDASSYKIIKDNGITNTGVLTVTGGTIAVRLDVVEVQVQAGNPVEFDNRDQFDPTTGLFNPTNIPKAMQGNVTIGSNIRIRKGTPGSGFPGTVQGWLPLAVVSVPATATTVDQMTFWDVRPLINDRALPPFALSVDRPIYDYSGYINAADVTHAQGNMSVRSGNRRWGGKLRRGIPGRNPTGDDQSIDLTDTDQSDASFSLIGSRCSYIYLCMPFGLPRWAKYTELGETASNVRQPRSPRGIPIFSTIPSDLNGRPTTAIPFRDSAGLGSGAVAQPNEAIAIATGAIGIRTGVPSIGSFSQGGDNSTIAFSGGASRSVAFRGAGTKNFIFQPGVDFPGHAQGLTLEVTFRPVWPSALPVHGTIGMDIQGYPPGDPNNPVLNLRTFYQHMVFQQYVVLITGADSDFPSITGTVDVPVPQQTAPGPRLPVGFALELTDTASFFNTTVDSPATAIIRGWKF